MTSPRSAHDSTPAGSDAGGGMVRSGATADGVPSIGPVDALCSAAILAVEAGGAVLLHRGGDAWTLAGSAHGPTSSLSAEDLATAAALARLVATRDERLVIEDARLSPALGAARVPRGDEARSRPEDAVPRSGASGHPATPADDAVIRQSRMRALIAVPVRSVTSSRVDGVLCVMQPNPRWWRPRDVLALDALATVAATLRPGGHALDTGDTVAAGAAGRDDARLATSTASVPSAPPAVAPVAPTPAPANANAIPDATADPRPDAAAAAPLTTLPTHPASPADAPADREPLDAVGLLAGGVAHDFNNLLTVVSTNVARLLPRVQGDVARDELLEIRAAADRAALLTQQLLAVGRKQVLQPEAIDLHRFLTELLPAVRRTVSEAVRVRTRFTLEPATVHVDPTRLAQAIHSLVANARDAMPDGGTLSLATDVVTLAEPLLAWPQTVPAGHWVRCDIQDEGIGIDEADRERILQPFFTTKPPGVGTGLGLPAVYGIVEQSGGALTIESEPAAGTVVSLWLPLRRREAPVPPAPRLPVANADRATILLVEDERTVRRVIERVLRDAGFDVLVATDGEEALTVARAAHVDLVVTDVVMPRMDGPTLVARLRASDPSLRVIYMSGYTRTDMSRLGEASATTLFLQKPFQPATLLDSVLRALEGGAVRMRSAAPS